MPLDPASLPIILAGPILRRVERDLVSVWIATSRPCDISLLLYDEADVIASETVDDDPRAKWVSQSQTTRQVGANLHILTVVLDPRTPGGNTVRSHGSEFQPNLDFSYDLRIFDRQRSTRHSLRSESYLDIPNPLGYDRDELPAFRTCPQDLDRLVIVHGSCRQMFAAPPVQDDPADDDIPFRPPGPSPDGWPGEAPSVDSPRYTREPADDFPDDTYPYLPKRDGMLWIDELIAARGPTTFADRPHQLFLTGDQIYADQPPSVLMPALNTLARFLVGPEDAGLGPTGDVIVPVDLENFPPGFRGDIVRRSGGLTTSSGESHLLSFGEFVAYYLLTWSPVLWDTFDNELWPADFDPSSIQMPEDWRVRFLFHDDRGIGDFSDDYKTFLENLPNDAPSADASPDEHAGYYFAQVRAYLADKYWTPELFEWWMRRFRQQLPRVRRALANVATFMVADDHDISDDWYFSRQWREQVFTRPLGVDIVRNGLMACSVMQSWGNDPRRWAAGVEFELLDQIGGYAGLMAQAASQNTPLDRTLLDRLHEILGLPHTPVGDATPTFRPLIEYSFQIEGPAHRVLAVDGRTKRRFPTRTSQAGGIDYEGATGRLGDDLPTGLPGEDATGLFGDSPMAAALPPRPAGDTKMTIVITGVPVIGPEGMELALLPFQRLARLLGDVDAESWSYEPTTYESLLAALARYESVVLLSGDIHLGFSAAMDYWSAPAGGPVRTARFVQLVSSGLTKDWGSLSPPLRNHALTHDVFESATNPALMHAERVGWGSPLRTEITPPVPLGNLVTHPERAHPFYRARLTMRAPVVPTHGWPAGTTEVQEPNWAWRSVMIRDLRPETTQPPNISRRWTPVELPPDQLNPQSMGWHAHAARKQAYGRVFAVNPNVGVVTFEAVGGNWSVRHVLAGELPPLPELGAVPSGLQPFVVHQVTLAPPPVASWNTDRPKIVDDGGWGVDTSEPTFHLLVDCLPRIWAGAAAFGAAVYADLPPVMDDVTREALITDAADRVSAPFRRRVVRQLGPFALLPDENLDAVTDAQIAALFPRIGRLNPAKEARALIRPDLERLLAFKETPDTPAAMFDDLLLLACSEWVYERNAGISTVAGVLATFRSPVTKHVPILRVLLGGLWDTWRNRTYADHWTRDAVSPTLAGLLSIPPRAVTLVVDLLLEAVVNLVRDLEPRSNGGPPVLVPELVVTAAGAVMSLMFPKRFTFVSGWEPVHTPLAPGTRATERTPLAMARQTLTMIVHPDGRARYEAPAQKMSATLIPPDPASSSEEEAAGSLLVGYDGGLQAEADIGAGFKARFELDGRAFHRIMWGGSRFIDGRLGQGSVRISLLWPIRINTAGGVHIALTPAASLALQLRGGRDEGSIEPGVALRIALNDLEDRVRFLPDDEFLGQLLPRDGLSLPLDAAWEWSLANGWRFAGFGELATAVLVDPAAPKREEPAHTPADDFDEPPPPPSGQVAEVVTPLNKRVGILSFHERRLEVTTAANDDGVSFNLTVSATVSLNTGPARVAVAGLGVGLAFALRNQFEESDQLVDFSVTVPTPTALAVSITCDAVSGGGFLQRIEEPSGAVTWRGGLDLRIGERLEATAFGIVQSGGGQPWSLLILLSVHFDPPVPLTAGLKLMAVGGLVALNRTLDVEALSTAARATTSQNNLDALLFPDRPEQRFLELIPALDRFFPVAPGHQVIGFLAEIRWVADTGTTFGDFRLALLGELESLQFALFGVARLGFPTVDDPHILRVRASVEALYDHRGRFARFAITLTEAFLFERIHLTGGAALMIRWGDDPGFALTLGGFHPSFRPFIPEGLREPPRIGAFWKPHDLIELSLQLYFARTIGSLQFGFTAHVEAGASWGGIRADAEFNFLVMVAPEVRFELDLSLRVTAFLFGADLISASFSGSLTGPSRWRLEGSVYWEVCGVSISKDLGPYYWGDPPRLSEQTQEARQLLGDALADTGNWSVRRSPALPVRLRPAAQGALDPRDEIDIRQSLLPLGVPVEVNDRNPLSDAGTWTLRPTTPALSKVTDLTDVFPTRRFIERPPKETPFRDGLASGVRVGGTGWTLNPVLAVGSDEDLTEDLVLDSLPQPPRREPAHVRFPFPRAVLEAAPARSPERAWTRHVLRLEAVA